MTEKLDLGSVDEGFQQFTLGGQTFEIDVYDSLKYIYNIQRARSISVDNGDVSGPLDLVNDMKNYLEGLGLHKVSLVHATKFLKYVLSLADDLKKNIGSNVQLPSSTV